MSVYFRPIARTGQPITASAHRLAGGWAWFDAVEMLERGRPGKLVPVSEVPGDVLATLTTVHPPIAGLSWDRPRLMGILNVTPDSFSDGGLHDRADAAVAHALSLRAEGADIVDVGGESTRPGATTVAAEDERTRILPVIERLRDADRVLPISVDTRKAAVATSAIEAGATLFNDVSALTFDPESLSAAVAGQWPVCLMHAQGSPETMQEAPRYDDVVLDVYDALAARIAACKAAGLSADSILIDPGIGFGKTLDHNLALLRNLSLFHGLGCPVLLGVSRKGFIGTLGHAPDPTRRVPGSIAAGIEGIRQGVQMLRVHDIAETRQAVRIWQALH